jgi:hypothetical protein
MVDMSIVTMVYQTTYNSRGTTLSACLARYYLGESVFLWWFPSFFAGGSSLARLECFFLGGFEGSWWLPSMFIATKWSPYFWTKPHIIFLAVYPMISDYIPLERWVTAAIPTEIMTSIPWSLFMISRGVVFSIMGLSEDRISVYPWVNHHCPY